MITSSVVDVQVLLHNWWAIVLRGVLAILFGLLTVAAPGISLTLLVVFIGAYLTVDGVFAILSAVRRRSGEQRWMFFFEGLVGVACGIASLAWPGITVLALLYLISFWAMVTGVMEIVAAIRLRKVITGEWLLALSGVLSLALGVLLLVFPAASAVALMVWVGAYAMLFGLFLVALGFRLRSWARSQSERSQLGAHAPV